MPEDTRRQHIQQQRWIGLWQFAMRIILPEEKSGRNRIARTCPRSGRNQERMCSEASCGLAGRGEGNRAAHDDEQLPEMAVEF